MFDNISDLDFYKQIDLSRYSTMKLQCLGQLAIAKSVEAVQEFIKVAQKHNIEYKVLGWGANQLLVDQASFIYLHLDLVNAEDTFSNAKESYSLSASTSLAKLTSHAAKYGLSGWEVFTGIPASLGGAIYMNAGTNLGEIGEVVDSVTIVRKNGEIEFYKVVKGSFLYRGNTFCNDGDVIVGANLRHNGYGEEVKKKISDYLKLRNDTQPLNQSTCGCMFKNIDNDGMTCRAGLSLDIMGLKGLSLSGVRVSHKHANFMENYDRASRNDVINLSKIIQSELALTLGLDFELEVDIGE